MPMPARLLKAIDDGTFDFYCRCCGVDLYRREMPNGYCRSCRLHIVHGVVDFCQWCGQPIYGRRGITCSRECRDNLHEVVMIERHDWDYDQLELTCLEARMKRSNPITIEEIIERKLRSDHGEDPVVIPELCPGGACWYQ